MNGKTIPARRKRTYCIYKRLDKKGGIFNIAKNLIHIEQNWLNNNKNNSIEEEEIQPYNQLDIDSLVNQINKDTNE